LLFGCSAPTPDPVVLEKMVQDTIAAERTNTPVATNTPEPSNTPEPTSTPLPSKTTAPTRTPRPYEDFYKYTNKFIEMFNNVTKLRGESDELKLENIFFEKVDGKTTLFIDLKFKQSRITDRSALGLPVIIMDDIRDNKKANIPGDINMIVITTSNLEGVKKLTINIKWPDLREFIDGNITFNEFFSSVDQIPN